VANGGSGKSFWNDPAVKYNTPIRSFFMAGFNPINQTGDNKRSMDIMKDPALLDLAVSLDIFMSPSAQYADYVLPATMPFETDSFTYSKTSFICVPKVIDPPGECLDDYRIVEGILKKVDNAYEAEVFQYRSPGEFLKTAFDGFKAATGVETTFEEFKEKGYIDIAQRSSEMANVNPTFKAYRDLVDTGSGSTGLLTASGKFDIYSQSMVEYYESRRWYNFDNDASRYPGYTAADLRLKHIGTSFDGSVTTVEGIYTKACTYNNNHLDIPNDPAYSSFTLNTASAPELAANMESARFVYPIPMYIPLIEGCHACDGKAQGDYPTGYPPIDDMRHPDPLGLRTNYPYVVGSHHSIYRAHSSTDNSPLANEVYKLNGMGGSAFRDPDVGKGTIMAGKGVLPAELGVYEPLNISPHDASALDIQTGNIILVRSPRASVLMCANVTNIVRKGITHMAEGAWSTFKDCRITFADGSSEVLNVDIAGSANSLSTQRPSRICQGSGYCAYQRINIRKVASVETV
jgi:anaerobic dimethyl sulfoxide reductase subunit A